MKVGRNDPCPCGSGRKFKNCCLSIIEEQETGFNISPELLVINTLMEKGYSAMTKNKSSLACDYWLEIWDKAKKLISEHNIKNIKELDDIVPCLQSFFNWCQDLELELEAAGRENHEYYEKRIVYTREFVELLPESELLIIQNMRRAAAESYFALGKTAEGEQAFKAIITDYPQWAWGYVGWGDMYWLMKSPHTPLDYGKALSIYQMGLDAGVDDVDVILERIGELTEMQKNNPV